MNPILTKIAMASALAVALIGSGFYAATVWKDGQITTLKLEHANERISVARAARAESERRIATQRSAEVKAQLGLRAVAADRARADGVGSGLRLTTAATVRASSENPAACAGHAATLGVVFDQCAAQLIDLAELADKWVVEVARQHEAAQ